MFLEEVFFRMTSSKICRLDEKIFWLFWEWKKEKREIMFCFLDKLTSSWRGKKILIWVKSRRENIKVNSRGKYQYHNLICGFTFKSRLHPHLLKTIRSAFFCDINAIWCAINTKAIFLCSPRVNLLNSPQETYVHFYI